MIQITVRQARWKRSSATKIVDGRIASPATETDHSTLRHPVSISRGGTTARVDHSTCSLCSVENSGLLRNMVRTSGYEPLIRGIGWVSELIGIVDPPAARLKE